MFASEGGRVVRVHEIHVMKITKMTAENLFRHKSNSLQRGAKVITAEACLLFPNQPSHDSLTLHQNHFLCFFFLPTFCAMPSTNTI